MLAKVIEILTTEAAKTILTAVGIPAISYIFAKAYKAVTQLSAIHRTIMPNGGKGLVDRVQKIEEQVTVIRESQRWRDTVNASETAMFECDPTGSCVHVNLTMAEMFGMPEEAMRGYGWLDAMLDSTERDRVRVAWETALENRMPYRDTYRVHNRTTGERFFAHAHAHSITTKEGVVLSIIGVVEKKKTIKREHILEIAQQQADDDTPLTANKRP